MPTTLTATDFLKRATCAAEHFGFQNIASFRKNSFCINCNTSLRHTATANDRRLDALNGMLTGGIATYTDNKLYAIEEPILTYNVEQVPRTGEVALSLQVFNVSKSIAEALLIQTTRSIARDLGYPEQTVRINSLGDVDSTNRYTRELTNYLRKRIADLPPTARELMKEHVSSALLHLIEKEHEFALRSPNPLEYLSDTSRKHFREIVEFLDMSQTPYEIDPKLFGHLNCYSDALFSLDLQPSEANPTEPAPLLIRGGRYDAFMRQHLNQEVPAAGAVVVLHGKKAPRRTPRPTRTATPSVYVVQLGFGPKIRSLMLLDILRAAGISVYQNLASDSLSAQLRDAESRQVKYTILIGQKEYVDGTVILRDMIGRNQEPVPLDSLVSRLRRLSAHA